MAAAAHIPLSPPPSPGPPAGEGEEHPWLWYGRLSSFAGIAPGATHVFARLDGPLRVELEWLIDATTAAGYTRSDPSVPFAAGDRSSRFNSHTDARHAVRAVFDTLRGPADALIFGDPAYADPQPVVAGPPRFVAAANQLVRQAERIGFYDRGHHREMEEIVSRWGRLLDEFAYQDRPVRDRAVQVVTVELVDGCWQVNTSSI